MRASEANIQHAATKVTNRKDGGSMGRQFVNRHDGSSACLEKLHHFICFVKTFCGNIYNKTA